MLTRNVAHRRLHIRWLGVLLLALSPLLAADQFSHPYLWQVQSTDEASPPSYLFGTIHSAHPELNRLPPVVNQAFEQADAFYAELEMTPEVMLQAAMQFVNSDGTSLLTVLSPQRRQRVNQVLSRIHPSLSLEPMASLKLWALTVTLPLIEDQMRYGQGAMDMRLYQRAVQNGKQHGGLETLEEQTGAFAHFSREQNLQILDMTLDYMERAQQAGEPVLAETYEAYRSGDPERLEQLLNQQMDLPPALLEAFKQQLLDNRNRRMAQRIHRLIQQHPGRSFFFAVGAAHYAGDEALQALLNEQGYRVTRVTP